MVNKQESHIVLDTTDLQRYVERFNADDQERYANIPNRDAFEFLKANIPLFDCPDEDFKHTYYFRWWTYRKHIRATPDGHVVTEFLPDVNWSGKHNTINCPLGHHVYEGRWLHDSQYLDDYARFWLRGGGNPRQYSTWIADAFYNRHLVTPNTSLLIDLLPDLIENDQAGQRGWTSSKHHVGRHSNGLYYSIADRDGMELGIGGDGYRPTLNSYMFGDARAIAAIARMASQHELAEDYERRAEQLKQDILEKLWDSDAAFFKVMNTNGKLVDVREQLGYTPWYFNLPETNCGYEHAWQQFMDPDGFYAPYGPTTAEQRHPQFAIAYHGHECQWNGPSWPFSTAVTLTALANLLNQAEQNVISKRDYFETLSIYTRSHTLTRDDGKTVPWIDENLNPYTGDWLARTRLKTWKDGTWDPIKGGIERGKDYNHSSYNDLIITGLVGLRPRPDDVVEINPLLPTDTWDYFCLDNVLYHGHVLTILWDKTGERYNRGAGLTVLAKGQIIAHAPTLTRVAGSL